MQPPRGNGCSVQTAIGCYRRVLSDGGSEWYRTGATGMQFTVALPGLQACSYEANQVTTMAFCPADAGVE